MANITNSSPVVTENKLKLFYNAIKPYLGSGVISAGFIPVGAIIAMMSNEAPASFLPCEGQEVNIEDYPQLANHFLTQFGSMNFFGGDGETTFAIPDLKGEFLRGTGSNSHTYSYGGKTQNEGSGAAVGVHQPATNVPHVYTTAGNIIGRKQNSSTGLYVGQADSAITSNTYGQSSAGSSSSSNTAGYTVRPTNTSVLYCISTKNIFVDSGINYSTQEHAIDTWIDGKILYEKTIEEVSTGYSDSGQRRMFNFNSVISNIDAIVNGSGYWKIVEGGVAVGKIHQFGSAGLFTDGTMIFTSYFSTDSTDPTVCKPAVFCRTSYQNGITKIKLCASLQYTKIVD